MQFASLGSGSRGNATLVEAGTTLVMVDCGFSCTEVERRMARLERAPDALAGILVTHEHADHISGVGRLARKYGLPVWMTPGTSAMHKDPNGVQVEWFNGHEPFLVGELEVHPFPVPHDAREPCQFRFSDGVRQLGLLTDLGCITDHVVRSLDGCDALLLECNHDPAMLADGPYPPSLKARVGGRLGHLSNQQAAELLERMDRGRLRHLVAAHISDKNNHPDRVLDVLTTTLGGHPEWLTVADQEQGFHWQKID